MEPELEPEVEPEPEPEPEPEQYYNTKAPPDVPSQVPEYADVTHTEEENLYDLAVEPSGQSRLPEDLYDEPVSSYLTS